MSEGICLKPLYRFAISLLGALLLSSCSSLFSKDRSGANEPVWPTDSSTFEIHGQKIPTPYRWLHDRQTNERKLTKFLADEQSFFEEEFLRPNQDLIAQIKSEILARTPRRTIVWFQDVANEIFWVEHRGDSSELVFMRGRREANGMIAKQREQEVINFSEKFGQKVAIEGGVVNKSGSHFAVGIDVSGTEKTELHVFDLSTGNFRNTKQPTDASIEWLDDGKTLVFASVDLDTLRPESVKTIHLPSGSVQEVYKEKDLEFQVRLSTAEVSKNIVITSYSGDSTEVYLLALAPSANGQRNLKKLFSRSPGIRIRCFDAGAFQVILSNHRGSAQDLYFAQLGESDLQKHMLIYRRPTGTHIRDFVASQEGVLLNAINRLESRLVFIPNKGGKWGKAKEILVNEKLWSMRFEKRGRFRPTNFDIWYGSYSKTVAPYNLSLSGLTSGGTLKTFESKVMWSNSAIAEAGFEIETLNVASRDGVSIPVTILYPVFDRSVKRPFPVVVTGYAAYGVSLEPTFYHGLMSLVQRGFGLAFVHARGGGDLGIEWHDAGRKMNKMNSFYDLIDAVNWLKANKWVDPNYVFAEGTSAGGLLMGAVMNLSPSLFQSVVMNVPFVDVLSTMLDEKLPLTSVEFQEWGNPQKSDEFDLIRSYSPVENVKSASYPSILVTAGLEDARVPYWESIKYVATIRKQRRDRNSTLLRMDHESGHEGGNNLEKEAEYRAQEIAFYLGEYRRLQHTKEGKQ